MVYNNPLVLCSGFCKDAIVPFALDQRLPADTLVLVFEEDYRFFPPGQDPDCADNYSTRVVEMMVKRSFDAVQSSESLPPQTTGPSASKGKSSGKGSKPKPESRFHKSGSRGSSDLQDEENEGFSANLADLVRWATVAHRHKMGNFIWVGWCPGKSPANSE